MMAVMIGIDPHKASHTAVAINVAEAALDELQVRACAAQAERLLAWAQAWPERSWAVEGAGGVGHLLAQQLLAAGERVLDVPPKLAARVRLRWAGFVSGLVARIVKSWPNRSWPAGQDTGQGLTRARRPGPGRDPEGQCQPADDRRGPAAITSGQETKQYRTAPWPGRAQPERARREAYRAGRDATGRTGTPKEFAVRAGRARP